MTQEDKIKQFKNQRSDTFSLVLNDNELNLLKSAKNIKDKLESTLWTMNFIAVIKHDKDEDENHNLKTVHYHLVIEFNGCYRIGTIINYLTDIFHINENQISIEKCTSLPMQTRYLCHIDDFDKHQYDPQDISTNNIKTVTDFYNQLYIKSIPDCVEVTKRFHYDMEEIMKTVANYDKYRKYINDLIINHSRLENRRW